MEDKTILELKNVRKVFGQTVALDSVSFTLKRGKFTVCWGEMALEKPH